MQPEQEHGAKNEEITVILIVMELTATSRASCIVCPHMKTVHIIMYVCGWEEGAGFHNHEATAHMAHCCNEGAMFLPLIYPDYTMECESLLMEPCTCSSSPSVYLSPLVF